MSTQQDKFKNSKRRQKDENAVKKQLKIANSKVGDITKDIEQPHRMAKRHAMDCGRPECIVCGNPRKIFKEQTYQEKSFYQDLYNIRDKKNNGSKPDNEI